METIKNIEKDNIGDRYRHIPKSKANHSEEPTAASCKNTEISKQ